MKWIYQFLIMKADSSLLEGEKVTNKQKGTVQINTVVLDINRIYTV